MLASVARVSAERDRLAAELAAMGWSVGTGSVTNFVLVDLGTVDRVGAVVDGLGRSGLVPRTFPAGHPLAGHIRITARSVAEDDRLLATMRTLATTEVHP
jgi:histidinol-phosphate/aromatic aminotransferase/cobyric acid decarboxylase-like protein